MDLESPVFKLQVITILDSTCFGLINPFLIPYIVGLGANQFIVGILGVGNLLCSLLSFHVIRNFTQIHGKRDALYMILIIAMVSHIMMIVTDCYWILILWRFVFSLTNQSQNLCRDLFLENTSEDKKVYFSKQYNILSGAGFIIGPSIAGCLYGYGFGLICLLAVALTSINIYLILSMSRENEKSLPHQENTILEKTKKYISNTIQDVKNADLENNWDILATKYLYLSSILIFSIKFPLILKHNYNSSFFVLGFLNSYLNSLNFAGAYFMDSVKNKYLSNTPILKTIQYGLMLSGILLLVANYSPVFILFAFVCGLIFFSSNLMNTYWKDISSTRGNNSLNELSKDIGLLVRLTIPLLFGLTHNVIGHQAIILFLMVPIFVSIYIFEKFTSKLFMVNGERDKQD